VGVNDYVSDEPIAIPILEMDPQGYDHQVERLCKVRAERDNPAVAAALADLAQAARGTANLMPLILTAVNAYATLGEICNVMREVFGEYEERVYF